MEFPLDNLVLAGDDLELGIRTLSKSDKEYLGEWEEEETFYSTEKKDKIGMVKGEEKTQAVESLSHEDKKEQVKNHHKKNKEKDGLTSLFWVTIGCLLILGVLYYCYGLQKKEVGTGGRTIDSSKQAGL